MPSGYRNKNTKVRYAWVANPEDPSGETKVRTETGVSSFVVKTDNLEWAPLELDDEMRETDTGTTLIERLADSDEEPMTVEAIIRRDSQNGTDPDRLDYMAIARNLPYNLGEAVMHIWLSVHGTDEAQLRMNHLRQARFHLADEIQLLN